MHVEFSWAKWCNGYFKHWKRRKWLTRLVSSNPPVPPSSWAVLRMSKTEASGHTKKEIGNKKKEQRRHTNQKCVPSIRQTFKRMKTFSCSASDRVLRCSTVPPSKNTKSQPPRAFNGWLAVWVAPSLAPGRTWKCPMLVTEEAF